MYKDNLRAPTPLFPSDPSTQIMGNASTQENSSVRQDGEIIDMFDINDEDDEDFTVPFEVDQEEREQDDNIDLEEEIIEKEEQLTFQPAPAPQLPSLPEEEKEYNFNEEEKNNNETEEYHNEVIKVTEKEVRVQFTPPENIYTFSQCSRCGKMGASI